MSTSKRTYNLVERWVIGWIPFWFWSAFVFQGAILPPSKIPPFFLKINDKLIHGTEYFILCLIAVHAFHLARTQWLYSAPRKMGLIYCAVMGFATEIAQLFVSGRSASLGDWIADMLGAIIAIALLALRRRDRAKG